MILMVMQENDLLIYKTKIYLEHAVFTILSGSKYFFRFQFTY